MNIKYKDFRVRGFYTDLESKQLEIPGTWDCMTRKAAGAEQSQPRRDNGQYKWKGTI